jgi:hypothetical protein
MLRAAYLCHMQQSPQVADTAPDEPFLTGYDMAHLVTYLRLLDADAEGAAWQEVARIVLSLDVETGLERANRVWASSRAGQMDDRTGLSSSATRRGVTLIVSPGGEGVALLPR